ncbi:helix-turn-helix domain-containing protein [Chryseobacterium sp. OV279]|uniref:helix-turn-helix domain-containing protein n=1 Tax=Chryseobacterium sp. OV279 TaxID=1500285 RepID=UPI00092247E0|nr:AraC family transcriptional regulator [Chryseobacterium sp. OV279]SHF97403.1 AraC-type DNA-binding protein [Chryseobacterium sp. OV279]
MALKLYGDDIENPLMERDHPLTSSLPYQDILECETQLDLPYGTGSYNEIYIGDIHIGYGLANLADKVLLNFETDHETVEMHFALKGKSSAISGNFAENIDFSDCQNNIIYASGMEGTMEWESRNFELFEINISPSFFKKFLPDESPLFETFRNRMEKGNGCQLNPEHNRINARMYGLINEIINCERKGMFKRMFIEAKTIELLLLQFEQISDQSLIKTSLKRTEIDKIHAVRDFIMKNHHSDYSLIELAHYAGTNEFTLKKGFKELFGTTVFGFWNGLKMDEARKMILEKEMTISEVSDAVGYKNPRHFSTAFKKKFGIIPSQLKKF